MKINQNDVVITKPEYKALQRLLRRVSLVIAASSNGEDALGWDHWDALLILDDLLQGKKLGSLDDYIHEETPGVKTVEQWLRKYGAKK